MSSPVLTPTKISPVRTFASDIALVRTTNPKTVIAETPTHTRQVISHPQPKTIKAVNTPPVLSLLPTLDSAIPPFHTFSKPTVKKVLPPKVTTIDTHEVGTSRRSSAQSTLTAPSHGVTVGDAADADNSATVITDTKHKRYSLTGALVGNFSQWYTEQKKNLTGENKPKYTIPEADRRKGVIQKATSQTGRTSTADHADVLARLRTARKNNQQPVQTPVTATSNTPPVWETAIAETAIVISEPKRQPTTVVTPQPVSEIEPVITTPIIPAVSKSAHIKIPVNTTLNRTPPTSQPAVSATRIKISPTIPSFSQGVTAQKTLAPVTPLLSTAEVVSVPTIERSSAPVYATLIQQTAPVARRSIEIPRSVYIVTAGFFVLGSIAGLFVLFKPETIPNPITSTRTLPEDIKSAPDSTKEPILVTTQEDIIMALNNQTSEDISLREVNLLSTVTGSPLSPPEFFTTFGATLPLSFVSAINQIRVGMYRGEPWIVLVVSDAPTGQGGMFAWEQTIQSDLKSWFGKGTQATNQDIARGFTDSIIDGRDVRLHKGDPSGYQILYGFINTNEILITTTDTSWLNLGQQLNSGL